MEKTYTDITNVDYGIGADIVNEASKNLGLINRLPVEKIEGTTVKLTVRTGLPTVSFRGYNEGVVPSKTAHETRDFSTAYIDSKCVIDVALAEATKDKARLMDDESISRYEATLSHVEEQTFYGVTADAKGFPGLIAQMDNTTAKVVDATGTANKTSVFFIKEDRRDGVSLILGKNSPLTMRDEWKEEAVEDEDGNTYDAWTNKVSGFIGCRLANKKNCVRIKNIGTAAGKGLTDDLLFKGLEKFTTSNKGRPTAIYMTSRSQEQLRAARQAAITTGAVAPLPTSWNNIPIVITDAISNAEA